MPLLDRPGAAQLRLSKLLGDQGFFDDELTVEGRRLEATVR
jgi:hypothetical protein